jgi:DNA-binding NtrC family response regulator
MMARILIVEDDNMIRERLVKALTFEGYDAVGAENGAVALRQKVMTRSARKTVPWRYARSRTAFRTSSSPTF